MQTDATFWSKIIVKKFSNDFIHMKILNEFRNKYHQIQKKKKKNFILSSYRLTGRNIYVPQYR